MSTRRPAITTDRRTNEVRCGHHDCYGNVCDECFAATPWLMRSYGLTFRMTGAEFTNEADGIADGSIVVSAATPTVTVVAPTEIRTGDAIIGYSSNAARPLTVDTVTESGADFVRFTVASGITNVIRHARRIAVVR